MHLHGNHFYVLSKEFSNNDKLILRDIYLMEPSEKSEFIYILRIILENVFFHCHMIEHAASGMMINLEVV